jgi:hypothetical protein
MRRTKNATSTTEDYKVQKRREMKQVLYCREETFKMDGASIATVKRRGTKELIEIVAVTTTAYSEDIIFKADGKADKLRCFLPTIRIYERLNHDIRLTLTHTQASKFLPLRSLRSCNTGAESRLMSLSEGTGEPSIHPFHPFLCAMRFFRGLGGGVVWFDSNFIMSSSSSGVRGRLDDVREVAVE